jgi:hypothetical protein
MAVTHIPSYNATGDLALIMVLLAKSPFLCEEKLNVIPTWRRNDYR